MPDSIPVACALALAATLHAGTALAQSASNSAAAQSLYDQGKALMAAGKAAEACPKLEESQRLDPGSGTLANLAKCYEVTGRIASAWSTYLEAAMAARATGNAERESGARSLAAALAPRVSKLVVDVPAEARVTGLAITRDGAPVGPPQWGVAIPVDEGEHTLVATAPGFKEWRAAAVVKGAGTTTQISVPRLVQDDTPATAGGTPDHVAPAPAKGLGAQRIAALSAGGVGVVGLVIGTVFGVKAMSDHSEAEKYCGSSSECTDVRGVRAGNDAHSAGNVATVGLIVGGVALAGGAVLWFTAPKNKPSAEVSAGLGTLHFRAAW